MNRTIRVFVIDESASSLQSICKDLELQEGMELIGTARSGFEATDKALQLQPDLVLIGLHKPRMTGLEFVVSLREQLPETKFIVVNSPNAALKGGPEETAAGNGSGLVGGVPRENLFSEIRAQFPDVVLGMTGDKPDELGDSPMDKSELPEDEVRC